MRRAVQGRTKALSQSWLTDNVSITGRLIHRPAKLRHNITTAARSSYCAAHPRRISVCKTVDKRSFSSMTDLAAWFNPQGDTPPASSPESGPEPNLEFKTLDEESINAPNEDNKELLTRRIHILGVGSIGTLITHSLATLPNPPPMTLMLHRPELHTEFRRKGRAVRLTNKKTDVSDEQIGFDVETLEKVRADDGSVRPYWKYTPHTESDGPRNPRDEAEILPSDETFIHALICTTKGPATDYAMKSIAHRVDSSTTILFVQNGLGQIDDLNRYVFTDPATRPTYMIGVISHGAYMMGDFHVSHAGYGTVAIGIHRDTDKFPLPPPNLLADSRNISEEERRSMFPSEADLYSNTSARYLLRTLTRCPTLVCAAYPYLDLFQLQLEKLVVNCVLNPITALLDVPNGAMLTIPRLTIVQRLLIAEIGVVLRALPELKGVPNVRARFSLTRLEHLFRTISDKTKLNSSSTREDLRMVRATELEYINGYIVKRGEQLGIRCVLNFMIMELVQSKSWYNREVGGVEVKQGASRIKGKHRSARGGNDNDDGSVEVMLEDIGTPVAGKT